MRLSRRPKDAIVRSLREAGITLPPDVADAQALREMLRDTDVFGKAQVEADNYLSDAFDRFRITMALIPELPAGARVLELGANPYFLTRLLLARGYNVTAANYFGPAQVGVTEQKVHSPERGETTVFAFDNFNIEADVFPYEDDSFDLVLCCEILEHLPFDPIHMLAEVHRVTSPTGWLLLTTPNATRTSNLLRMLKGDNPYEELSGHGIYGRHNREYTVDELELLLGELGYEQVRVLAADIHEAAPECPSIAGVDPRHRGENLFALAQPVGQPRWRYPRWLYASQHALLRVVRPDVTVGSNDALQARGLWDVEFLGGQWVAWTGPQPVELWLAEPEGDHWRIRIEGFEPAPGAGPPMVVTARGPWGEVEWSIACEGMPISLEASVGPGPHGLEEGAPGRLKVELTTDRTWSPAQLFGSGDGRALGFPLARVSLERA